MKLWQVAVIGLILSITILQQCSVNGQNCYINHFDNFKDDLNKCDNLANVKTLVFNVKKLDNVPHDVIKRTQSVESIDISKLSLQYIDQKLGLCQWKNLKCIDADDNNVTTLHSDILFDCPQLDKLSLARNNMHQIYEKAFTGLSQLTELDLSYNQLTSISAETFQPLTNLRQLRLNNNMIRTIKSDHFAQSDKLQVLDLSYNAIVEIKAHAFQKWKELTTLNIQCNPGLTSIDLHGMDKLNKLNTFNASLYRLGIPKNTKTVNADNNRIVNVTIEPNSMLQSFSLKNNSLQNLSNLSLAQQLQEIDISSNNINDIDFSVLMKTDVKKIVALDNPIRSFDVTSLVALPKLKLIEISTGQLDNDTRDKLLTQTKQKGILLEDPKRTTESIQVVTMSPATSDPTNKPILSLILKLQAYVCTYPCN